MITVGVEIESDARAENQEFTELRDSLKSASRQPVELIPPAPRGTSRGLDVWSFLLEVSPGVVATVVGVLTTRLIDRKDRSVKISFRVGKEVLEVSSESSESLEISLEEAQKKVMDLVENHELS